MDALGFLDSIDAGFEKCMKLQTDPREGGQGGSPRGDVATSWGEHSMHTFNCSCTGPFHGLTQAVDYT